MGAIQFTSQKAFMYRYAFALLLCVALGMLVYNSLRSLSPISVIPPQDQSAVDAAFLTSGERTMNEIALVSWPRYQATDPVFRVESLLASSGFKPSVAAI